MRHAALGVFVVAILLCSCTHEPTEEERVASTISAYHAALMADGGIRFDALRMVTTEPLCKRIQSSGVANIAVLMSGDRKPPEVLKVEVVGLQTAMAWISRETEGIYNVEVVALRKSDGSWRVAGGSAR